MNNVTSQGFIRNLAIMASAGTGKTYQLAMRYILLILKGAKPEDIVAVTFTKKAAGEIFEKIMTLLLELILNREKLQETIRNGFFPENVCRQDLVTVLQKILSCRKKLHIETNDSFLMQSVQSSPAQFGIMGKIAMLDDGDDRPRIKALLQALRSPVFSSASEESFRKRQDIYMILRDTSMGKDKSNLCQEVTDLLRKFYNLYLEHPRREDWLLPIPEERQKDLLTRLEVEALVQQCSQILEQPLHEKICRTRAVLDKFTKLQECAGITSRENAVSTHDKDLNTVAEFFLGKNAKLNVLSDLEGSETSFLYARGTYSVSAELFYCVRKLMFHIAASEYLLIRRKTRAIYDLMAFFDESYALQTRRQGLLTFQDILYLINSKEKSDYGVLQMLRERLALNIDHYLLDEFQDTSDTQWSAMRDLISDVIQWNEESRFTSFFMVADVKQSLYQWRKGNPEIFWNICSVYGIIPEEDVGKMQAEDEVCNGVLKGLNCSYRSASAVLQMVNDIFHDPQGTVTFPDRLAAHTIPFHTQRAKMNFLPHISGLGPGVQGGAMFLEVEAPEHKDLACIRTVCEMIRTIDPFSPARKKKLSVAVLARKNSHLRTFYEYAADYMPELKVSMEGKLFLADSMGYAVFRQLLIYGMHPGDPGAEGFFSLLRTPSGEPCSEEMIRKRLYPRKDPAVSLRSLIRSEVETSFYSGLFRHFRTAFPEVAGEFQYMDILEELLLQLEEESLPGVDELLHQLDGSSGDLRSMSDTVQLMTVHKSKGLGFDIVFYLDVIGSEQSGDFFDGGSNGSLYFMPRKVLREYSALVMQDAEKQSDNELYEFLCNLYVALTRAKCAQYFIGTAEAENSKAQTLHFSDVLRAALSGKGNNISGEKEQIFLDKICGALAEHGNENSGSVRYIYSAGDPLWYEVRPEKENHSRSVKKQEDLLQTVQESTAREKAFLQQIREQDPVCRVLPGVVMRNKAPSHHKTLPAMRFLPLHGAEFGTAVHEFFRTLRWISSREELSQKLFSCQGDPALYSLLESLFSHEEVSALFREVAPEGGHTRLLLEQPFQVQNDSGIWINGIMDRAVIRYDQNGSAVSGEVIDFKTDLLETPEEFRSRYGEQLETYREALGLIASLSPEKISCVILSVRKGFVIRF